MSRTCVICQKGRTSGNNVSHSNRHTKRSFGANVHKVKISVDGSESTEYVCTRCLRTSKKAD